MAETTDKCSVRVAVRIRPQSVSSSQGGLDTCTTVALSRSQIAVGEDKAFTFDHVFDEQTGQEEVFERCVQQMVEGTFDGYNATILAYGQTGSGKTFTMGTSFKRLSDGSLGIIPRAAAHIFNGIQERQAEARENNQAEPMFEIVVQFIELYNEEIIDLLASAKSLAPIRIVEDLAKAEISLNGASNVPVRSIEEMLRLLQKGAQNRTTMATNMNQTSSRSHAVFSVFVKQTRDIQNDSDVVELHSQDGSAEFLSSKLHFVDLAGSERLKKTGATGDRAKEGISINSGLLALGNVISILGVASKNRPMHIPYRDSKLTRLLQDSLGGNRTLMIACVSSNLSDYAETLSTLQYANRAKNIKNKVVVNHEKIISKPKIHDDVLSIGSKQADNHAIADDWLREVEEIDAPSSPSSQLSDSRPRWQLHGPYDTESTQKMRDFYSDRLHAHEEHMAIADSAAESLRTTILQRLCAGDMDKKRVGQLWMELEEVRAENKLIKLHNEDLKRENGELRKQLAAHRNTPVEVKEPRYVIEELHTNRKDIPSKKYCPMEAKPCAVSKPTDACNQFVVPDIKTKKLKQFTRPGFNTSSSGMGTLPSDSAGSRSVIRGQASQKTHTTRRSRSVGSALRDESPHRMFHNVRAYFEGKSKRKPSTHKNLQQQFRF